MQDRLPELDLQAPMASRLRLRRADWADVDLLYEWRNRPDIVALALTRRTVSPQEHRAWFEQVLSDPLRLVLLALLDNIPAGQIRFDPKSDDEWEVSAYLVEPFQGRGLGAPFLEAACHEALRILPARSLTARVLRENPRSLAVFGKIGFVPTTDVQSGDSHVIHLVRHRKTNV